MANASTFVGRGSAIRTRELSLLRAAPGSLVRNFLVTTYAPARTTGRGLRTCGVIEALARLGPLDVAYVPFEGLEPAPDLVTDERVALHRIDPSRGPARLLVAVWAAARGATWDFAKAVSPELIKVIRHAPAEARLIADGPTTAAAVLPLARRADAIYLAHNLESSFRGTPALRRFERRLLREFRESWMATEADIRAARDLAGDDVPLRYAPNVVDVASLPVVPGRPGRNVALFVGDFRYSPNQEGLDYLVTQVMPLVWKTLPEASVLVVGRGLESPPSDSRIRALGFVEDLDSVYAQADAVVVPLLTGGGSPLKFVEALARGIPVVTTGHAAALMEHGRAGEHFLAASDASGFADALVAILRGNQDELGARGRALAERFLSIEALTSQLS